MNNIIINHKLKVLPEFYDDVESGLKPFEVRIDDREPRYWAGDLLQIQEWNGEYTGRECFKKATYVLRDERFCKPGYCVIGLAALRAAQEREKPLTLEELKQMNTEPLKHWVWVEIINRDAFRYEVESMYCRTHRDYTNGEALCCGWPGMSYALDYTDYGNTWLAYRSRPKEGAGNED